MSFKSEIEDHILSNQRDSQYIKTIMESEELGIVKAKMINEIKNMKAQIQKLKDCLPRLREVKLVIQTEVQENAFREQVQLRDAQLDLKTLKQKSEIDSLEHIGAYNICRSYFESIN